MPPWSSARSPEGHLLYHPCEAQWERRVQAARVPKLCDSGRPVVFHFKPTHPPFRCSPWGLRPRPPWGLRAVNGCFPAQPLRIYTFRTFNSGSKPPEFRSLNLQARSCLSSGGGRFERQAPPQQTAWWLCIGGACRANPDVRPEAAAGVRHSKRTSPQRLSREAAVLCSFPPEGAAPPKRRLRRMKQGAVGAALQYLQGR